MRLADSRFGEFRYRRRQWRNIAICVLMFILAVFGCALALRGERAEANPWGSLASYYGPGLYGNTTASGDVLDYNDWTAAHPTLPMGSVIKVCYERCARGVVITDRGPAKWTGRSLDLNMIVAEKIGLAPIVGVDDVYWEVRCYGHCAPTYR